MQKKKKKQVTHLAIITFLGSNTILLSITFKRNFPQRWPVNTVLSAHFTMLKSTEH